jgi:alpha-galactosidase
MARILLVVLSIILGIQSTGLQAQPSKLAEKWITDRFTSPDRAPISFRYGEAVSEAVLKSWQMRQEAKKLDEFRTAIVFYYTEPGGGMQIRCECVAYNDVPVAEWVVYIKNTGTKTSTVLQDIQALDLKIPAAEKEAVLHFAKGALCCMDDYMPMRRVLNKRSKVVLQPGGGRSSSDYLPFFNIEQMNGNGTILGLGWSGEWAACFATDSVRQTRVTAGMALTHLRLRPDEEIRTPKVAVLFYDQGLLQGQNLWRKFILAHHCALVDGKPFAMPILNGNWGGTDAATHLANIQAIKKYELPIDYYWIDAEWFGKGKWHQTAGDWRVKKELYPQGFKPISDLLHASGMKLLLWFETERVCEGTPWYTEHKNWLLSVPKKNRCYNWGNSQHEPEWIRWESLRNQIVDNDRLIDLGNAQARRFITDYISYCIDEFGLDCYRHDANVAPLEFWRAADAPDRQGMSEIRWVQGLYDFWDELLRRHPGLIIDNCASGGRRIDLESLDRSIPFWRTDFPGDPIGKQCHTYGLSSWAPLNATGDVVPGVQSNYIFRSTISSSVVVGLPAAEASEVQFRAAKEMLQKYRDIQPLYLGDYYPLTAYSQANDAWMAWQFHRTDLNKGMVQIFRRPESISESAKLCLHGLDPAATYIITDQDRTGESQYSGEQLMNGGLPVTIAERPSAVVLLYRKK